MTVFPQGTLIWQRFTNVSSPRTYHGKKRQDPFDPQRVKLVGEDSMFMVKLLVIPETIVFFFFYYMIDLLQTFHKRYFVLSSEHKNQNVATTGTRLHQFMLSCK